MLFCSYEESNIYKNRPLYSLRRLGGKIFNLEFIFFIKKKINKEEIQAGQDWFFIIGSVDRRYDPSTGSSVPAVIFRLPCVFYDENRHQYRHGGHGETTISIGQWCRSNVSLLRNVERIANGEQYYNQTGGTFRCADVASNARNFFFLITPITPHYIEFLEWAVIIFLYCDKRYYKNIFISNAIALYIIFIDTRNDIKYTYVLKICEVFWIVIEYEKVQ